MPIHERPPYSLGSQVSFVILTRFDYFAFGSVILAPPNFLTGQYISLASRGSARKYRR
jgi:hypothetical protein